MTKSPGPYTNNNQYRIRPSNRKEGKWHVQWRCNSICYWFFSGMGWETDYEYESAGGYTFHTPIEYDTEKQAEQRIQYFMRQEEKSIHDDEIEQARQKKIKEWSKSKKARKVPPFLHL